MAKETDAQKIKRLQKELDGTRARFRHYREKTRFVWNEMALHRRLLIEGYAQHLPIQIARQLSSNPLHSAQSYDDGMVWTVVFPQQRISFDKKLLPEPPK